MIFKIFLSNSNTAATNVDLINDSFTTYTALEEVLLLPNFCFQVTDIHKSSKREINIKSKKSNNNEKIIANTTTFTLVEMPY